MFGNKERKSRNRSLAILLLLLVSSVALLLSITIPRKSPTWGATFSIPYADYLGIDWKEAYISALDELGLRYFRIPAYWSDIEVEPGIYDFSNLDFLFDEAAARDAKITLALGVKVPRWPECFLPEWVERDPDQIEPGIEALTAALVARYSSHPSLHAWQVENEPFFPFGECPDPSIDRLTGLVDLVRDIDDVHPIQRTTSGEQSFWLFHAPAADILGVSMYRVVFTEPIGYNVFPHTPAVYRLQSLLAHLFADEVIISELQVEPWFRNSPKELEVNAAYQLFTAEDLWRHGSYAKRSGLDAVYLWGVEWWYYLRQNGDERLWNAGRGLIELP